jgi:hypothetical protein
MIRASALYFVIVIAFVIGLLCAFLILTGYYYKVQYQQKFRDDQLATNSGSGVNLLLTDEGDNYLDEKSVSLFGMENDTVALKKMPWGIFDIGIVKAHIQQDTVYTVFSIANQIDSAKWAALYLVDEDRPLSVSGKTRIQGNAFLPQAGIKEAYVNNQAYQGDKRLVIGNKKNSSKFFPELRKAGLQRLQQLFQQHGETNLTLSTDSVHNSFLLPTGSINFRRQPESIRDIRLSGNIILFSDTTLFLEATASLTNVLVFAKKIVVQAGFQGACQLFATDTILVEKNCRFDYPSCMGVLQFGEQTHAAAKISIGEKTILKGLVFSYQENKKDLKAQIELDKDVKVFGQVFAPGILAFNGKAEIFGSAFAGRFRYQSNYTLYENYLIDITLDAKGLSPYYLTSSLVLVAGKKKKVLQWIESK